MSAYYYIGLDIETFKKAINALTVRDKGDAENRDTIKLRQTRPFMADFIPTVVGGLQGIQRENITAAFEGTLRSYCHYIYLKAAWLEVKRGGSFFSREATAGCCLNS